MGQSQIPYQQHSRVTQANNAPSTPEMRGVCSKAPAAGSSRPFDSDEHLFEVKWDGIRALAYVEDDGYRLLTRHHRDLTAQFPELDGLARLGPGVVLDGDLVVLRDAMPHLGSVFSRQHTADPLKIRRLAQVPLKAGKDYGPEATSPI